MRRWRNSAVWASKQREPCIRTREPSYMSKLLLTGCSAMASWNSIYHPNLRLLCNSIQEAVPCIHVCLSCLHVLTLGVLVCISLTGLKGECEGYIQPSEAAVRIKHASWFYRCTSLFSKWDLRLCTYRSKILFSAILRTPKVLSGAPVFVSLLKQDKGLPCKPDKHGPARFLQ